MRRSRVDFEEHEHEFQVRNYTKPFTCDGCKEPGFGVRYICDYDGYHFHQDCIFPESKLSLDFFPSRAFQFFNTPQIACGKMFCEEHKRSCDACGKDIKGYNYHCVEGGWDLHPCCSNLEKKLLVDGITLELRDEKVKSRCVWCKETKISGRKTKVPGWSYVSGCGEYVFHVFCVKEMIRGASSMEGENQLALAKVDLKQLAKDKRKDKKWGSFWKILKVFISTVISVLVGDPTALFATMLVELISNA